MADNMQRKWIHNGVDKNGNPLHFTGDMLKPFMRVKLKNGTTYIAVPYERDGGMALALSTGWTRFRTPDSEDVINANFVATEIYAHPDLAWTMFETEYTGELIWKYKEPEEVKEPSEFDKRLAYLQTHIDAVKENLESLQGEYNKLKLEAVIGQ